VVRCARTNPLWRIASTLIVLTYAIQRVRREPHSDFHRVFAALPCAHPRRRLRDQVLSLC
jgi:hypothetical protein